MHRQRIFSLLLFGGSTVCWCHEITQDPTASSSYVPNPAKTTDPNFIGWESQKGVYQPWGCPAGHTYSEGEEYFFCCDPKKVVNECIHAVECVSESILVEPNRVRSYTCGGKDLPDVKPTCVTGLLIMSSEGGTTKTNVQCWPSWDIDWTATRLVIPAETGKVDGGGDEDDSSGPHPGVWIGFGVGLVFGVILVVLAIWWVYSKYWGPHRASARHVLPVAQVKQDNPSSSNSSFPTSLEIPPAVRRGVRRATDRVPIAAMSGGDGGGRQDRVVQPGNSHSAVGGTTCGSGGGNGVQVQPPQHSPQISPTSPRGEVVEVQG